MSSELSEIDREVLHNLMDTALALKGNAAIAAWNAAARVEVRETHTSLIKRLKAAQ